MRKIERIPLTSETMQHIEMFRPLLITMELGQPTLYCETDEVIDDYYKLWRRQVGDEVPAGAVYFQSYTHKSGLVDHWYYEWIGL